VRPALHTEFVARAVSKLSADPRVLGVAAGGSWARDEMDEHSDVDLLVAVAPVHHQAIISDGPKLAASVGSLLACFPGDHLGKATLLICLYGPPLLHVDFSFHSLAETARLIGKASILWDRDGTLTRLCERDVGSPVPEVDLQWMEDRIWVWLHYGGSKVARGELFEAIDAITFIRGRVLGPLMLALHNRPTYGVRRVEMVAGHELQALRATVAAHDAASCLAALGAIADLYRQLRDRYGTSALVRRSLAEAAVTSWLEALTRS
jgi:hypothetical protein